MKRIRFFALALGCATACAVPAVHAGLTCYDASSYSSNFVSAVQETLAKARFNPGPADGRWGVKTKNALKSYQASKRLEPTGNIDASTLRALFGPDVSPEAYGLTPNRHVPAAEFKEKCR